MIDQGSVFRDQETGGRGLSRLAMCSRPSPQARFLAVPILILISSPVLGGLLGPDVLAGSCIKPILLATSVAGSSSPGGASGEAVQESRTQQKQTEAEVFPGESAEDAKARMQYEPSLKPERMSIDSAESSVPMGNPVRLVLKLAPGKVNTIIYSQSSHNDEIDAGAAKVVADDGVIKTIEFVPRELGPLEVLVMAIYSDNAFVKQTVKLNVVPSAVGLKKFALDGGRDRMTLKLHGVEGMNQDTLKPTVVYEALKLPQDLRDARYIKVTIEQDQQDPVVRLEEDGTVFPLRPGKAVIVGDYDGVKDRINVLVEEE